MAIIPTFKIVRGGEWCLINQCDLDKWVADGWELDAPKAAKVEPVAAVVPEAPVSAPVNDKPKRGRMGKAG
jgi:hypothetical protein